MSAPEVWLRGPVDGVPPLLQPVAHALLQVAEDVPRLIESLTTDELCRRPGGSASIAYHAVHLAGSLGRLFTYARGEHLTADQMAALRAERETDAARPVAAELSHRVTAAVGAALAQLRATDPASLLEPRAVGRAALPSTTLGLLFHAAEHATRHAGQIATLVKVIRGARSGA